MDCKRKRERWHPEGIVRRNIGNTIRIDKDQDYQVVPFICVALTELGDRQGDVERLMEMYAPCRLPLVPVYTYKLAANSLTV